MAQAEMQYQTYAEQPVVMDENEERRKFATKPRKYQERIAAYIQRVKSDNHQFIMEDLIEENQKLRKEIDMMRNVNTSLKREFDEFRETLLQDRISNFIAN